MRVTVKTTVVWVTMVYVASFSKRLFLLTSITWQHIQEDSLWVTPEYKASSPRKHLCSWWCRITWRHIPEVSRITSKRTMLGDELHGVIFQKTAIFTNSEVLNFLQANCYTSSYKLYVTMRLKIVQEPSYISSSIQFVTGQFLLRARSSRCNLTNNGTGIIAHSL